MATGGSSPSEVLDKWCEDAVLKGGTNAGTVRTQMPLTYEDMNELWDVYTSYCMHTRVPRELWIDRTDFVVYVTNYKKKPGALVTPEGGRRSRHEGTG